MTSSPSNTYEKIYQLVQCIPAGSVATYGDVAHEVDTSPRVVGNALHANPDESTIPCHRIVNHRGALAPHFAFGGFPEQQRRLESEGVAVMASRVDLTKYRHRFHK